MCLPCAEAQGLSSGDITGKKKANNKAYDGIRRDATIAAATEYESLHSNVDNSSRAQANALAVAITNLTVELAAIKAKKLGYDVTTRSFGSSRGKRVIIWF
jgi:hypothetical protein